MTRTDLDTYHKLNSELNGNDSCPEYADIVPSDKPYYEYDRIEGIVYHSNAKPNNYNQE